MIHLLGQQRAIAVFQRLFEHVGEENGDLFDIDLICCRHTGLGGCKQGHGLQLLPAPQELATDLAKLLQDRFCLAEIVQMLFDFFQIILRDIVHLGPLSRLADREVVLGAMATALGAAAPGFSTTLVAFDEGAPEHGSQVGQASQELFLFSPESGSRFL